MKDYNESNRALRVAFCVYRGNPYSGGQGVYTKYLTQALADLGHSVTVFSGPPYPELDERVELVQVPSLDLFRHPDPFRVPRLSEFRTLFDLIEYVLTSTGAFSEPRVFGYRVKRLLESRIDDFDIVHDNQSLTWSLLRLHRSGLPMVTSIHHPITIDKDLEIKAAKGMKASFGAWRFYSFVGFQSKVAQRVGQILTVSEASKRDMVSAMGVNPEVVRVVPIGVDTTVFRPLDHIQRNVFQIVTTASADVTLKGLAYLIKAVKELTLLFPSVSLVIIGARRENSEVQEMVIELGLQDRVTFLGKISQLDMVEQYARASVACVPSVYEGFSLPAIEAMACAVPLVVTNGGALPEVVGRDEHAALIAQTKDFKDLAICIAKIFKDHQLALSLAHHARLRVLAKYSWKSAAIATAECYKDTIESLDGSSDLVYLATVEDLGDQDQDELRASS